MLKAKSIGWWSDVLSNVWMPAETRGKVCRKLVEAKARSILLELGNWVVGYLVWEVDVGFMVLKVSVNVRVLGRARFCSHGHSGGWVVLNLSREGCMAVLKSPTMRTCV